MTNFPIGVVLETESHEVVITAVKLCNDIGKGTRLKITNSSGLSELGTVIDTRSAGGIFTPETAAYHLNHLDEVDDRMRGTYLIVEIKTDRSKPILAGSVVSIPERGQHNG